MPKKPSDFLNKKRGQGNGDFARSRRPRSAARSRPRWKRRNRRLAPARGSCPSPNNRWRRTARVPRCRGAASLDEHLGQLAHHSAKQRTAAACGGAREITTAHGDEAWRCFAPGWPARRASSTTTTGDATSRVRGSSGTPFCRAGRAPARGRRRRRKRAASGHRRRGAARAARLGAALGSFDAGCRKGGVRRAPALIKNAAAARRKRSSPGPRRRRSERPS